MKERGKIEKLWREEKYRVLFHDQNSYHSIRTLLKSPTTLDEVEEHIANALTITLTKGSVINAFEHMWGYFKKQCTQYEKQHSRELKKLYIENQIDYFELLSFLKNLADKYAVEYLQQSTILNITK